MTAPGKELDSLSTRELVLRLYDRLHNGIKYDRKRNLYIVVWTARELAAARRRAKKLHAQLNIK